MAEQPSSSLDSISPRSSRFQDSCSICRDKSTGFHYDVPSCNGCKSFFRRTIINKRVFRCVRGGKCTIDKCKFSAVRSTCPACRFKKCVQVGMNPRAIQTSPSKELEFSLPTPSPPVRCFQAPIPPPNLLNSLMKVEEAVQCLRLTPMPPPPILLDVLTRPSQLTKIALCPEIIVLNQGLNIEMEIFALLEYAKSFDFFCFLSFSDKLTILCDRIFALLVFRLSWYNVENLIQNDFCGTLEPTTTTIRTLAVDIPSIAFISALILCEDYSLPLSQEGKLSLSKEKEIYSSCFTSHLIQKYGMTAASTVSQHFHLIWGSIKSAPRIRELMKDSQPENSLFKQLLDLSTSQSNPLVINSC